MAKRYKIWKAGINQYRVLDTRANVMVTMENLHASGCAFLVSLGGYYTAREQGFENSGHPLDYFAWIEADKVVINTPMFIYPHRVQYNPHVSRLFEDRAAERWLCGADSVATIGNLITYNGGISISQN